MIDQLWTLLGMFIAWVVLDGSEEITRRVRQSGKAALAGSGFRAEGW